MFPYMHGREMVPGNRRGIIFDGMGAFCLSPCVHYLMFWVETHVPPLPLLAMLFHEYWSPALAIKLLVELQKL